MTKQACSLFGVAMLLVAGARTAPARVLGGGPARTDCYAAFGGVEATRGPLVDCQDGDPACDVDGTQDGTCTFGVSACLAQDDVPGCTPPVIEHATVSVTPKRAAQALGIVAPATPATPTATPSCGAESVVRLPLRTNARGAQRPSQVVTFRMVALAATAPRRDADTLRLRCVPNTGGGQCPANPAGGPRELRLTTPGIGTDLDNGFTGLSHNFPVPSNAQLRVCLAGCDAISSTECSEDQAATNAANRETFGSPLPLLAAGVPVCVVNRFAPIKLEGFTADLSSGAVNGTVNLMSDLYLSSATAVCPRCTGMAPGEAGVCDAGARQGRACVTDGVVTVVGASGDPRYTLSPDCPPAGAPAGTLALELPVTTGSSVLPGPKPCGAAIDDTCGAGTCSSTCTGAACVSLTADGQCVDSKGGISQTCCSTDTSRPCFPTADGGSIVRDGSTTPPTPASSEAPFPATGSLTLAATFCEQSSGSATVNAVTGLPGPGSLLLPMDAVWLR